MDPSLSPTKGNLISLKKSLSLAMLGYDLMDRKRNILLREMMPLVEVSKTIRKEIKNTFNKAYEALKTANITLGLCDFVANSIEVETGVFVKYKSIMGLSIPKVTLKTSIKGKDYGVLKTNSKLDIAYMCFNKAKEVVVILAEIENSLYLLAKEIKKTKTRANALKNIVIPKIKENIKYIENALEEKEREEFGRLKTIKNTKA